MKTKKEIIENWLPRYTGVPLAAMPKYVLLTNFNNYLKIFCTIMSTQPVADNVPMRTAIGDDICMINFGMGSPNAATVMDLLGAIQPKAVLFLGKCGGLKHKNKLGDLILPIAAIRGEGTSHDYFPPEVPALPAFNLQKIISLNIRRYNLDYWTGTVYTTNRRVWEHDDEFKVHLRRTRSMAIDMETATIFTVGFYNKIPSGALLLVSDQPMISSGVKTASSDKEVSRKYVQDHVRIGIETMKELQSNQHSVKHLRFW